MELAVFLILVGLFLIGFKLLALVFKAGFFVLTIPFQILGAILGALLVVFLLPFAIAGGVLAVIFAPLLVFGPLLPLLLIAFGVYLISKN